MALTSCLARDRSKGPQGQKVVSGGSERMGSRGHSDSLSQQHLLPMALLSEKVSLCETARLGEMWKDCVGPHHYSPKNRKPHTQACGYRGQHLQ